MTSDVIRAVNTPIDVANDRLFGMNGQPQGLNDVYVACDEATHDRDERCVCGAERPS